MDNFGGIQALDEDTLLDDTSDNTMVGEGFLWGVIRRCAF
jgi:hypothetical protein